MNRKFVINSFVSCMIFVASFAVAQETQQSDPAKQKSAEQKSEPSQQHKHTNSLAKETSPYLLLHAHNPVDWYPWSQDSLAMAKTQNKPIFLSIGYSSCHWCHVMERESFLDEEIAKFLNDNFICIKVDREERPDVDAIYMESLHVINQLTRSGRGGGWPLSMFLTPDAKPFFGGTYFPARDGDRGARIGFLTLSKKINENWVDKKDRIEKDAKLITDLTKKSLAGQQPFKDAAINKTWFAMTMNALKEKFDPQYGGFRFSPTDSQVPKFPEPSNLYFLAEQIRRDSKNEDAIKMLTTTCERMMMGGIYDHLGGGFHRYSVDRYWAIPHFEKMLYDNGQLATVYSELYQITGREDFKWVVDGIMSFLQREMTDANGGFYSALDAESENEEGKFYRWDKAEIQKLLSDEEYKLFAEVYGINLPPNFEGHYAPQLKSSLPAIAASQLIKTAELEQKLIPIRKKLFDVRAKRPRPLTDNKILASWNGLMIRGCADAGRILKNEKYTQMAETSAKFVLEKMIDDSGRLIRTVTGDTAKLNAYLEDYACVIDGFIALHRATGQQSWIDAAEKIQKKQDELFWDDKHGGYFFTSSDHEVLIARSKKQVDGAMPSGNSVSAGNLLYLSNVLQRPDYKEKARKCVISASALIEQYPIAAPRLLITAQALMDEK